MDSHDLFLDGSGSILIVLFTRNLRLNAQFEALNDISVKSVLSFNEVQQLRVQQLTNTLLTVELLYFHTKTHNINLKEVKGLVRIR